MNRQDLDAGNPLIANTNGLAEHLALSKSSKPLAKRWDHVLSTECSSRRASRMQALHASLSQPGILSLGPGAPRCEYYPIYEMTFKVPTIGKFTEDEIAETGKTLHAGRYDMRKGKSSYDLSLALNYGQGTGSQQLVDFMTEHVQRVHNPPYHDWQCILTGGNTYMLDLAFRMFTERGRYVLVEEYTYPTALETGDPLGVKFTGIKIDSDGIIPEDLEAILNNWDPEARQGAKPQVLYTVPTGQNPTGATLPLERKQAIYRICQKHDVYIMEDDPYYFVQMRTTTGLDSAELDRPNGGLSIPEEDFVASLVPSFLRLDTDGRVLRMDSFSKVIAPGSRTGWVTASEQIIERIIRAHETSLQNPSGFSQAALFKLLHDSWGHGGLSSWLFYLQREYTLRRDALLGACKKYMPSDIVTVTPPKAGFFAWLKVDWTKHSQAQTKGVREIERDIYEASVRNGALVVPGSWFQADLSAVLPNMYFRATYAPLDLESMDKALSRVGEAIKTVFGLVGGKGVNGVSTTNGEMNGGLET